MASLPRRTAEPVPVYSVAGAAALLAVSESTVRRALKGARDSAGATPGVVTGQCRGRDFVAWRDLGARRPRWRIAFPVATDVPLTPARMRRPVISAEARLRQLRDVIAHRDHEATITAEPAVPAPAGRSRRLVALALHRLRLRRSS